MMKVDYTTPYPPEHFNFGIRVKKMFGPEAQIIPYVCAQVAHRGRGSIGISKEGDVVFHLPITREDQMTHLDLVTVEEMWIVMKPDRSLTDPYHDRKIVL